MATKNLLQRWQECRDKGNLGISTGELLPYMRQAAERIDFMNSQQPAIIHRDIKPEHVLLTEDGRVKVCGFGMLVEQTSADIEADSVGMTLAYAAPELFRNAVTKFTDQYSLGLTYYRLRVGRLPFDDGLGPIQIMQAHASGVLNFSGVPEAEQHVLRRACAVDPQRRFGSCLEFVSALETVR